MKVLTLTQPWATLVAIGAKTIETRSWGTSYRGPLAIHAAQGYPAWAKRLAVEQPEFAEVLAGVEIRTGVILAVCRLAACVPTDDLDEGGVIALDPLIGTDSFRMTDREWAFGDFSRGRKAWLLADVRPLDVPLHIGGKLGLWDLPRHLEPYCTVAHGASNSPR